MSAPRPSHPLDSSFFHTLRCPICWAAALRRKGLRAVHA